MMTWRAVVRAGCGVALVASLCGCETLKPYEKEYLLSPLMDDAGVAALTPAMNGSVQSSQEKLAAGAGGGGGSTSCPTCGG